MQSFLKLFIFKRRIAKVLTTMNYPFLVIYEVILASSYLVDLVGVPIKVFGSFFV